MRVSRKLAAIGAAAMAAAALTAVPAGTASAASGCWDAGFTRLDNVGRPAEAYYCYDVAGAAVWDNPWDVGGSKVGWLYTGTNWFVCSTDNGDHVGGPHPYRWEWTEADNGNWGWVKDTDVYSETNPLSSCGPLY